MKILSLIRKIIKYNKQPKPHENLIYKRYKDIQVSKDIQKNKRQISDILKYSSDVVYREIELKTAKENIHLLMVYIEGMIDKDLIDEQIQSLLGKGPSSLPENMSLDTLRLVMPTAASTVEAESFDRVISTLLSGNTLLFLKGANHCLVIASRGGDKRPVGPPTSEQNIKGPKEGFIESLQSNIVMVRRIIKDPNLAVEKLQVGRRTQTDVAIIYINGIVRSGLVDEIKSKLYAIDTDGLMGIGSLEQFIENHRLTIVPEMLATERPDRAAGNILEGRVVLIIDGTPFVLIVPTTFSTFLNSPEDNYERSIPTSLTRIIRYTCFFVSTTLQPIYLSLTSYHPGMLPPSLVLSITGTRMGLPFPNFLEVILMEFILYVLQEAAIRLPQQIGQTVSIVGGLVIGQAVVQAGIVSPIIVIIVAMSAISSFAIPVYTFTIFTRTIRVILIGLSFILGLYGVMVGWLLIIVHMASIENFGVRYLGDFSPLKLQNLKDTIVKVPKAMMFKRPPVLETEDVIREASGKAGNKYD